ncbi:MAG: Protein LemA [Fimbriimonadaceae bacterium]|nr:Protein LemA [Fimbriimonadaceae bacterium]
MNMPLLIGLAAPPVFLMILYISTHNQIVRRRSNVTESWSNIDVVLRRRHDLIPNLVRTVQAHAAFEKDLLERLVAAREDAIHGLARTDESARLESRLAGNLKTVLARVEDYPDLKTSQAFLELQSELVNTEDRIAAARRFYNSNVREYNTLIESFPASWVAQNLQARPESYYELDTPVEALTSSQSAAV